MAFHPKRSRILSTAWSAAPRAIPRLVPGRRASPASPSGSSSASSDRCSRCDTEIPRSEMVTGMIRQQAAHQFFGELGKDYGGRDRCVECCPASDRLQVGEADADRHGSPAPRFGAETAADPVCQVKQGRSKNPLVGRFPAQRGLRSCRSRPAAGVDFPRVVIPRQSSKFLPGGGTEQLPERASR
jgi:hypothetical protein